MATLTKTLISKRDRALAKVENAVDSYNEVLAEIADDLSSMASDIKKGWDDATIAAERAQAVLDEVQAYCREKQAASERRDDHDEAEAWGEIADAHDTDCEVFPDGPADVGEDMDEADLSCTQSDFIDEA